MKYDLNFKNGTVSMPWDTFIDIMRHLQPDIPTVEDAADITDEQASTVPHRAFCGCKTCTPGRR